MAKSKTSRINVIQMKQVCYFIFLKLQARPVIFIPIWIYFLSLYKSPKFHIMRQQLLDEEFENLRRVALAICENLGRPKDREICRSTLEDLAKFRQGSSIRIKENVHKFLMFYLKVLRWSYKNQPTDLYRKWVNYIFQLSSDHLVNVYIFQYGQNFGKDPKSASSAGNSEDEQRVWLEEGKSFYAMKTFEDGSTVVYSAVVKDARAGWSENGLKTLMETQVGCALNRNEN